MVAAAHAAAATAAVCCWDRHARHGQQPAPRLYNWHCPRVSYFSDCRLQ